MFQTWRGFRHGPYWHVTEAEWKIFASSLDDAKRNDLYLGRAGELFAAAHLLRLGLNAAPLTVDTGVDLILHSEM